MKPRRAVVVDADGAQRAAIERALQADGDIAVVGGVGGATEAVALVESLRPDVVILDLQLADRGAQRVVEQLMAITPTPILVLAGAADGRNSVEAVDALVAGAVDVLPKPGRWSSEAESELRSRVRIVAGVAVIRHRRARTGRPATPAAAPRSTAPTIVGIGASTGGPAALAQVLEGLAGLDAAVLVVQHLHADFVPGLVSWMDRVSPLQVQLARGGERVRPGVAYIGPGGVHLRVDDSDELVLDTEPAALHRPSVDVLFASLAARRRGKNVGVLLTGMGDDGAEGLLALRRRGDVTIAQDEASSVVFGMPRAAQRLGAAVHVLPLTQVASAIVQAVET